MGKLGKWHFIGIGGVGMSAIAKICLEMGRPVSGSDLSASNLTDRLTDLGAKIYIGHDANNIASDVEAVIVSTAIHKDNPELIKAKELNIPVIPRGASLASIMDNKKGIAISGAHGKTTTSAMAALLLEKSQKDPAYLVGAYVADLDTNGKWGNGEYMTTEADESDGSFLLLNPYITVVTNVEDDHLDYYGSQENIDKAFISFVNKVEKQGIAILCSDDAGVSRLMDKMNPNEKITYGFKEGAQLRGTTPKYFNDRMMSEVTYNGEYLGTLDLGLCGDHNMLNALAATAIGLSCGLTFDTIASILADFHGAHRRMEKTGVRRGIKVFDDYAHHPSEIKATINAANRLAHNKIIVAFQPHRYTRTKLLAKEFGEAFGGCDELLLLPIYSAGEYVIEGVSSKLIADEIIKNTGKSPLMPKDFSEAVSIISEISGPGDIVITMGAGDVYKIGPMVLETISEGYITTNWKLVKSQLKELFDVDCINDAEMKYYGSWKIGGPVSLMALPKNEEQLMSIYKYSIENDILTYILGLGTNILVSDEGMDCLVINTTGVNEIRVEDTRIYASSGACLAKVSQIAMENGLTGLEFACGIPGTVGGAVRMNAGAYGGTISEVLETCDVFKESGVKQTLKVYEMGYGYRKSILQTGGTLVLGACLKLQKGNKEEIAKTMKGYLEDRKLKQPLEYPSCGSVFRNPSGNGAGRLIDGAGLKGRTIGNAKISEKHANFIINTGNAKATDVISLIKEVKSEVKEKYNENLVREVVLWGIEE